MSILAFLTFAWDKAAARRGGRRVPEATLHVLSLLGGWPGAFLAMLLLRHKVNKPGFLFILGVIVMAHAIAWWRWA
jgi:uncharacterized membrane protein YsdA (DUF1294 family)